MYKFVSLYKFNLLQFNDTTYFSALLTHNVFGIDLQLLDTVVLPRFLRIFEFGMRYQQQSDNIITN